jgi:hypothetical protein
MKLPSLERIPSKDPKGALTMSYKCPNVLEPMYEGNLMKVYQNLTIILKIYMALPIMSCEAERNFSNRSIIKIYSIKHDRGKTGLYIYSL